MLFKTIKNLTSKEAKEIADNKRKQYIEEKTNRRYKKIIKRIYNESNYGFYDIDTATDFCCLYSKQVSEYLVQLLNKQGFNVTSYNSNGIPYITISWR